VPHIIAMMSLPCESSADTGSSDTKVHLCRGGGGFSLHTSRSSPPRRHAASSEALLRPPLRPSARIVSRSAWAVSYRQETAPFFKNPVVGQSAFAQASAAIASDRCEAQWPIISKNKRAHVAASLRATVRHTIYKGVPVQKRPRAPGQSVNAQGSDGSR
jgi:hypothetical protein